MYGLLAPTISAYELAHGIVRGTEASIDTARMFGEFYPNPGDSMAVVSMPLAMVAEGVRHVLAGDVYLRLDGRL